MSATGQSAKSSIEHVLEAALCLKMFTGFLVQNYTSPLFNRELTMCMTNSLGTHNKDNVSKILPFEEGHVCCECGESFSKLYKLRRHHLAKHIATANPNAFRCLRCCEVFQYYSTFMRHSCTAHGQRNVSETHFTHISDSDIEERMNSLSLKRKNQRKAIQHDILSVKCRKFKNSSLLSKGRKSKCMFCQKTCSAIGIMSHIKSKHSKIIRSGFSKEMPADEVKVEQDLSHIKSKHSKIIRGGFSKEMPADEIKVEQDFIKSDYGEIDGLEADLKLKIQICDPTDTCSESPTQSVQTGESLPLSSVIPQNSQLPLESDAHFKGGAKSKKKHMVMVHEVPSKLKCSVCQVEICGRKKLKKHMKVHNSSNIQNKSFHMILRSDVKRSESDMYKCGIPGCKVQFAERTNLLRHITLDHKYPIFHCKICDAHFKGGAKSTKKHMVRVHKVPSKLKCHVCQVEISGRKKLKKHMKVHNSSNIENKFFNMIL